MKEKFGSAVGSMAKRIVYLDTEINREGQVCDIGAVDDRNAVFHSPDRTALLSYLEGADILCGHNLIHHDLVHLGLGDRFICLDTLYLSPLLFPRRPYHALLKDDKLQVEEINNPVNDAMKARDLFLDEVRAYRQLPEIQRSIYAALLRNQIEFRGFFGLLEKETDRPSLVSDIRDAYQGSLCENAPLQDLIRETPVELAYALALIATEDPSSVPPHWVLFAYPRVESVLQKLRSRPCGQCAYCRTYLSPKAQLRHFFGYQEFRTFEGEPLQQKAVEAAASGESLLAVFPTGGGKSITFQLPALMEAQAVHGLTVVISPLQALMKDQVDQLRERGINSAVTINSSLDPVELAEAIRQVEDGSASLLYISPEKLRNFTTERLLLGRQVVRFVIDEAHCFSAWGQDFRVEYLYIAEFIREYQDKKHLKDAIPVSCFTATAKQKVISDICEYFRKELSLHLSLFTTQAERKNLHYAVRKLENPEEKYALLRAELLRHDCPAIVYTSTTRRTEQLASRLSQDGIDALPYHGKMESRQKNRNQEAFLSGEVRVMVATSAFGMGVDKPDIGLVIHYDISDSLENYVQEAGRAGRDPSLQADCYVLFCTQDLDAHFLRLNQTKLTMNQIQQIWKAVKDLTRERKSISVSPLELARAAGWSEMQDMETRVRAAVNALEVSGYLRRGKNMPHVYGTGLRVSSMQEASERISASARLGEEEKGHARRIMSALIGKRSRARAGGDAESRVDYLAEHLGLTRRQVVDIVNMLRQEGMIADSKDMTAFIASPESERNALRQLEELSLLELMILSKVPEEGVTVNLKQWNEEAQQQGLRGSSMRSIRRLLAFMAARNLMDVQEDAGNRLCSIVPRTDMGTILQRQSRRTGLCRFIINALYQSLAGTQENQAEVQFSLVGLYEAFCEQMPLDMRGQKTELKDVEEAILFLSRMGILSMEGGFLIQYNTLQLERLRMDNRVRYKQEDYRQLNEHYSQKAQQIHIVEEYASLMVRDLDQALVFVRDYFAMPYRGFVEKYFSGEREEEIKRTLTREKFDRLFGMLSPCQMEIIRDKTSPVIVVAAGPGSGKTTLLAHKLASLLLLEEVRHEQLLMLTFSRAAATAFKKKLLELIGGSANFVEIKTFHSYAFDLLGRMGTLETSDTVVREAAALLREGGAERDRTAKACLVIDEAQDMDEDEFSLVQAIMECNEGMRVLAVGDDDQNIYAFRGSDSAYMKRLLQVSGSRLYEMTDNFRSAAPVVAAAEQFVRTLPSRMKHLPLRAAREGEGKVLLTVHPGEWFEEALIAEIASNQAEGQTAVLTSTNEEALTVLGLLQLAGIRARLIQSMDGFRLGDLAEVRFFLSRLDALCPGAVLAVDVWERCVRELRERFARSLCLPNCLRMLSDFRETRRAMYRSDFEEFLSESRFEDFDESGQDAVIVTTVHKAKGREFDRVLLMQKTPVRTAEEKRRLYVGMTRARSALSLHVRRGAASFPGLVPVLDEKRYGEPVHLCLELSHRDVVLDFFRGETGPMPRVQSGTMLEIRDGYGLADGRRVLKLSRRACQQLEGLRMRGIEIASARVRFAVLWHPKEEEACWALLPTLLLERQEAVPPGTAEKRQGGGPEKMTNRL